MKKFLTPIAILIIVGAVIWFAFGQPEIVVPAELLPNLNLPVQVNFGSESTPVAPTPTIEWAAVDGQGGFFDQEAIPLPEVTVTEIPIPWDEDVQFINWVQLTGLSGVPIFYRQSSTDGNQTITLEIPEGYHLVFGALSAEVQIGDDEPISAAGFYGWIEGGQQKSVTISYSDGFIALVPEASAELEFCARLAQAQAENWLIGKILAPRDLICSASITVPVDVYRDLDLNPDRPATPTRTG